MASVTGTSSASNIYSALGIKNKGIGGLVSGLDTDSLVEALTAGTRAKIAKQGQSKTLLQWQQTAYRSVASTLQAFQDKNLSKLYTISTSTPKTNICGSTFWSAYKTSSSSKKVTANSSTTTGIGSITIDAITSLASKEKIEVKQQFTSQLSSKDLTAVTDFTGQTLKLKLDNGTTQTIALDSLNGKSHVAGSDGISDFERELQSLVDAAMGMRTATEAELADAELPNSDLAKYIKTYTDTSTTPPTVTKRISNVMISMNGDGGFNIASKGNGVTVMETNETLGLTEGKTNRFSTNTKLKDMGLPGLNFNTDGKLKFKINDVEFEFTSDTTMASVMSKINSSTANVELAFNSITQQFSLTAKTSGEGQNIRLEDVEGNFLNKFAGVGSNGTIDSNIAKRTAGTNAEILVDGQILTSATNTFEINGLSFTVTAKTDSTDVAPIIITSEADTDELVTRIQGFIDDYNALVDVFNTLLNEEKNSDYAPLTDEQKAEMTDEQIKTWENEAKKGLLRNDSTLRSILDEMRRSFTQKVESAGLALYDIGITTQSLTGSSTSSVSYKNSGKLEISDESKLRAALTEKPDAVRKLFTDGEQGVGIALYNATQRAICTDSNPKTRGSLVRLAGTEELTGDNTSTIGNKINSIDKYVSTLKLRLQAEYTRHWKKFTALETAISNMSAQSSWLNQNS